MKDWRWLVIGWLVLVMPLGCQHQKSGATHSFFESQWAGYKDEPTPLPPSTTCEEIKKRVTLACRCFIDRRWSELQSYLDTSVVQQRYALILMRHYREKGPAVKDLTSTDTIQAHCIRVPLRFARYYVGVLRQPSDIARRLVSMMQDAHGHLRTSVTEVERRFWQEFAFVEVKVRNRYFIEVLHRRDDTWYLISNPLGLDSNLAQEIIESKSAEAFAPSF